MNKRWLAFLLMIILSLSGAFAEETGPEDAESVKTAGNCEFIFFDGPELSSLSESVPPTPLSDAEEVQRAVGHPRQLHEWALLDAGEVNTVIASAFRRSWRARKELEKSLGAAAAPLLEEGKKSEKGACFLDKSTI